MAADLVSMGAHAEILAETPAVIPMIRNVTVAKIITARIIVKEAADAIQAQCPVHGITMTAAAIMITETLQDLTFRESEEGKPAAAIIIPSRTKSNFLLYQEGPVQLALNRTFVNSIFVKCKFMI